MNKSLKGLFSHTAQYLVIVLLAGRIEQAGGLICFISELHTVREEAAKGSQELH